MFREFAHVQQTGEGLVSRGSERFPICIETFGEIGFVVAASVGGCASTIVRYWFRPVRR